MKRRSLRVLCVSGLVLCLASSVPLEALCWGSLYVASRSSRLSARCPNPNLTKTWRVRCYDGCGHTDGNMTESLGGSGECFKGQNCIEGVKCLPLAGPEIVGFNPPSLSASIVNTEGYYASRPCSLPSCRSAGVSVMSVVCSCDSGWDPISCADNDPIIISLANRQYWLTDREGGVSFDIGDTGVPVQVPWTHPDSDEAFLVLDRNDNGTIDNGRELFGDITPQHVTDSPNGFLALALFDDSLSGGNEDGRISAADEIYPRLGLWRDANHNGISEPEELLTLTEVGLEWIDLDYRVSPRVDRHGNEFRYRSRSGWTGSGTRRIWNVFLVAQ